MNDKHRRFCEEYLKDSNGAQAAIRAGYSERTAKVQASRLLTNVDLKSYIKERQKELDNDAGFTREKILNALFENHNIARSLEQTNASNKALELIGKAIGLFVEKQEVEHSGTIGQNIIRIGGQDIPL